MVFLFCCSVLGSQRRWKDWVVIIRCEVRVGLISSFRHQPLDVLCTTSKNYVEAIFPSVLILCSTMAPNHAVCHQGRVKGGVAMLWDAAKSDCAVLWLAEGGTTETRQQKWVVRAGGTCGMCGVSHQALNLLWLLIHSNYPVACKLCKWLLCCCRLVKVSARPAGSQGCRQEPGGTVRGYNRRVDMPSEKNGPVLPATCVVHTTMFAHCIAKSGLETCHHAVPTTWTHQRIRANHRRASVSAQTSELLALT